MIEIKYRGTIITSVSRESLQTLMYAGEVKLTPSVEFVAVDQETAEKLKSIKPF